MITKNKSILELHIRTLKMTYVPAYLQQQLYLPIAKGRPCTNFIMKRVKWFPLSVDFIIAIYDENKPIWQSLRANCCKTHFKDTVKHRRKKERLSLNGWQVLEKCKQDTLNIQKWNHNHFCFAPQCGQPLVCNMVAHCINLECCNTVCTAKRETSTVYSVTIRGLYQGLIDSITKLLAPVNKLKNTM